MKTIPSKAELRRDLEQATRRFLDRGGHISEVPKGATGCADDRPPVAGRTPVFVEPRQPRTPLTDVIAELEARRAALRRPAPKRPRKPEPRREVVYDDFGEPVRRVWVED